MSNNSFAKHVWAAAAAVLAITSVGCKFASVASQPSTMGMEAGAPSGGGAGGADRPSADGPPTLVDAPQPEKPPLSLDAACAANSQTAKQVPLDAYIMFDQSGSMSLRWDATIDAVKAFLARPSSAGLSIGIQYFAIAADSALTCATNADCPGGGICTRTDTPGSGVSCNCSNSASHPPSCDPTVYARPDVEIAPLPDNYAALAASLDRHCPESGTPTGPALQGAIMKARDWTTAHPGHKTIVVLVTDGDPNDCSSTLTSVEQIASDGLVATPRISTFVIGMGSSLQNLDGIAQAGGTEKALLVEDGPTLQDALAGALDRIRGSLLPCEFLIPTPPPNLTLDYNQVNVSFTATGQTTPRVIPRVDDLSQCTGDGWAYDNRSAPQLIRLCPTTCDSLHGATGTFNIILGCDTVVQ